MTRVTIRFIKEMPSLELAFTNKEDGKKLCNELMEAIEEETDIFSCVDDSGLFFLILMKYVGYITMKEDI